MAAQNQIDEIILRNVGENGFFIEAGGSDPRDQNNTNLLESKGWTGLIIEPKNDFNNLYSILRPKSILENYVLVSKDHNGDVIYGDFSHYMMGGVVNIHQLDWNPTEYKCATLDFLLKKNNISEVTFFSLDVEGYEVEVLKGINFNEVFFHIIVIENHEIADRRQKDDFNFLNEFNLFRKYTINQHEFYINKNSKYFEGFTI